VPDDKLDALMAELRAIELWDRLRESSVLVNEFDRAGGSEARRMRRHEIVDEIDSLLKKEIEDSERTADEYAAVKITGGLRHPIQRT
jgi:hypothetical protein